MAYARGLDRWAYGIQPCLITIWRVDRGVGAYAIRPAIAGGRLAATVARRIRRVCGKGRAYAIQSCLIKIC